MDWLPTLEVKIIIQLQKLTTFPLLSVTRPSSRSCSIILKTSGWAFSLQKRSIKKNTSYNHIYKKSDSINLSIISFPGDNLAATWHQKRITIVWLVKSASTRFNCEHAFDKMYRKTPCKLKNICESRHLHFVKQHDRIRSLSDGVGELSTFLVANVTRWGSD